MVLNEPNIAARTLRRQGIAALHFSNDASDLEGANPLAPPTFLGGKTLVGFIKRADITYPV